MRRFYLVILVMALTTQAFAQQVPSPQPEDDIAPVESPLSPMPLQVQPPTQRILPYDRVMYVLDVSCSMSKKLAEAITVTDAFVSDGFKAAVVTFSDTHSRWGGVRVPCKHPEGARHSAICVEEGWSLMPTHRTELFQHLRTFSGTGGTSPTSALDYAIKNVPSGTLIVFISDGDFTHLDEESEEGAVAGPLSTVRSAIAWRRNRKLAPVQMLVWATSKADSQRESLTELAKLGGSGLWRADTRTSGPW
jgi:hypothetical protein